jgi:hypothetical protein
MLVIWLCLLCGDKYDRMQTGKDTSGAETLTLLHDDGPALDLIKACHGPKAAASVNDILQQSSSSSIQLAPLHEVRLS